MARKTKHPARRTQILLTMPAAFEAWARAKIRTDGEPVTDQDIVADFHAVARILIHGGLNERPLAAIYDEAYELHYATMRAIFADMDAQEQSEDN